MNSLLLASLLSAAYLPALAANNPEAQELFVKAEKQANLFHDQARPFQLEIDFLAQFNVPTQGHLTLKWKAKIAGGARFQLAVLSKSQFGKTTVSTPATMPDSRPCEFENCSTFFISQPGTRDKSQRN